MSPRGTPVRLVEARSLSPSVRSLAFEPVGGSFGYGAGQSVQLTVPTATGLAMRRPYSFASAPSALDAGRFEIAVSLVDGGPTSTALHALRVGADVLADGPHGGWLSLRPDERDLPTLLVATGSGLAPFRALIQEQLRAPRGAPIGLLFGARTTSDILWADELETWEQPPASVRVAVTLSRPDPRWTGRTGHVQSHLEELVRAVRPELVLLCGLSAMTDDVETRLRRLGISGDAIRTEAYDRLGVRGSGAGDSSLREVAAVDGVVGASTWLLPPRERSWRRASASRAISAARSVTAPSSPCNRSIACPPDQGCERAIPAR